MLLPSQSLPFTQVLVRVCEPPLQLRLQALYEDHDDQLPETGSVPGMEERVSTGQRETDRERDRQRERQRERQTDRERDKQWRDRERKTERQRKRWTDRQRRIILSLTSAVEGPHVFEVTLRQFPALAQFLWTDIGVHRFDSEAPIARECPGTVMHDGHEVVRHALGRHEVRVGDLKVALPPCLQERESESE